MKAAIIFLFLMWPALCAAQADTPVAEPEVKAGDRWTYRRMASGSYNPGETYEMRVTFAARNAIHVVVTGKDGRESDATYTPEWNDVVSPTGRINSRARGELQFPLTVGASYKLDWFVDTPHTGHPALSETGSHKRTVKVAGWEEIAVPAGKFRALRVEAEGRYEAGRASGLVREVFWYVPEIKRWAKHTYDVTRLSMKGSYRDRGGEELVEFKVQ